MDRTNYTYQTLPSYLRYSRRDMAKSGNKANMTSTDSAYANIRQKISTASISVPYEKGLDTLRVINLSRNSIISLDDDVDLDTTIMHLRPLSRGVKRRPFSLAKGKKSVNISKSDPFTYDIPMPRIRPGSEDGSSIYSIESKQSKASSLYRNRAWKDKFGSETSSISSRSRPPSYSSWNTEDSVFSERLDDLKERYSENSEFIASIRRQRLSFNSSDSYPKDTIETDEKVKTPTETTPKPETVHTQRKQNRKKHTRLDGSKIKDKPVNSKYGEEIKTKRTTLPPIHMSQDEYSTGITTGFSSNSETPCSEVATLSNRGKRPSRSKKRKVEFNFSTKPKRSVRLPPLQVTYSYKPSKKPKSILKKNDASESSSPLSHYRIYEEDSDTVTEADTTTAARWQIHLPKLRSPVPSSESRRQPILFQRNNFQFKCSKEFEAAAVDETESVKSLQLL